MAERMAVRYQGAIGAARPAAGADGGAQVHDSLGVGSRVPVRCLPFGKFPQLFLYLLVARPAVNSVETGQHPFCVAVENGSAAAMPQGQYCSCGGAPDTG